MPKRPQKLSFWMKLICATAARVPVTYSTRLRLCWLPETCRPGRWRQNKLHLGDAECREGENKRGSTVAHFRATSVLFV